MLLNRQLEAIEEPQHGHARQRSPSPEEKEFEDDDGTVYVWNEQLRKFQPKSNMTAPALDYKVEDMVFEADDEQQPAFETPVRLFCLLLLPYWMDEID